MEAYFDIHNWMQQRLQDEVSIQSLNTIYDQAMIRVVEKALQEFSPPPCNFSWFVLGSGGRRELVSTSDQDHGIIFEETGHEHYFQKLGQTISDGLFALGFAYCEGKVMSSERQWCKSVDEWKAQISEWRASEDLKDIRHMQMIIDARMVYGSEALENQMKDIIFPIEQKLLELLATNMSLLKKGLTPLGQLIVDQQQRFDYKNCIYVPYVNAVRLLKLQGKPIDESLYEAVMKFRLFEHPLIKVNQENKAQLKVLTKAVKKLHNEVITHIGIRC
ncbi:MAG: hypothetical protein KBT36_05895 [Kurthia sp.]|nr:hypothetical protein [Candidatus Kurthia equi]